MRRLPLVLGLLVTIFTAGCSENYLTKYSHRTVGDYFSSGPVMQLAEAAARGRVQDVERLAKSGVDVDSVGNYGVTPLVWAVGAQNLAGVEILLKLGANPNRSFEEYGFILDMAIGSNNPALFELLLKYKGDPNWRDPNGGTAIGHSLLGEDPAYLALALKYGGDPNLNVDVGNLLERSTVIQHFVQTLMLLKKGADPMLASERAKERIVGYMKSGYWAFSKDPAYNECLRILRERGLTIEIDPNRPTRESDRIKQESQ